MDSVYIAFIVLFFSHGSMNARPQSMVGATRLVSSEPKEKRETEEGERRNLGIMVTKLPMRSTGKNSSARSLNLFKLHVKFLILNLGEE